LARTEPSLDLVVLQDAQQLGLGFRREVADLVQEERAAVRLLSGRASRVGEGSFSCPNSSDSKSVAGIALQFTATNGPEARQPIGEARGRRAPSGPRVAFHRTVASGGHRAITRKTSCISRLMPIISLKP
jgi:hypothetical protein